MLARTGNHGKEVEHKSTRDETQGGVQLYIDYQYITHTTSN